MGVGVSRISGVHESLVDVEVLDGTSQACSSLGSSSATTDTKGFDCIIKQLNSPKTKYLFALMLEALVDWVQNLFKHQNQFFDAVAENNLDAVKDFHRASQCLLKTNVVKPPCT